MKRVLEYCAVASIVVLCACSSSKGNAAGGTSSDAAGEAGARSMGTEGNAGGRAGVTLTETGGAAAGESSNPSSQGGDSGAGDASSGDESGHGPATAVAVGQFFACALTVDSTVQCWGDNTDGSLGNGGRVPEVPIPGTVVGLTSPAAIAAGGASACALSAGGGVDCWGDNTFGQLGNGNMTIPSVAIPVAVTGLTSGVTAVSVGADSACALTVGGGVQCWGRNSLGELGDGVPVGSVSAVPVPIASLSSGVSALSVGGSTACAITAAGDVMCWGDNTSGQVGNGSTNYSTIPVPAKVTGLTARAMAVSVGGPSSCAITENGGVECWGYSFGIGSTLSNPAAFQIPGLTDGVTAISVGSYAACALAAGGVVKCWGASPASSSTPAEVAGLPSNIRALCLGGVISTGDGPSACAVTEQGGVECWGGNTFGGLGDGSTTSSAVPVEVTGF
jgi:alpha-tubulin suppressor-like RCC1 family protein